MPRLQWTDRDGEMMALGALPILVGKDPSCILRPKRRKCAPRHARFFRLNGVYFVEALSPEHPLSVNGTEASSHALVHRDVVRCGDLEMTYWQD